MKRLFLLIVTVPVLLFSYENRNFATFTEIGWGSKISYSYVDSLSVNLFLLRMKYLGKLSDNTSLFMEGEYSTFSDTTAFPYIKRDQGKLYLRNAFFRFKLGHLNGYFGRFIPDFNYMLSRSILDLPSIHYPIVNDRFLNGGIDGLEGSYGITIPYDRIKISVSTGRAGRSIYKLGSVKNKISENVVLSLYYGSRGAIYNNFDDYVVGGYINYQFNTVSITGGIGRHTEPSGESPYCSVNGIVKLGRVWINLFYDSYGNEKEIVSSLDFWAIKNRFDIAGKYEVNLNGGDNRLYLLLKGII